GQINDVPADNGGSVPIPQNRPDYNPNNDKKPEKETKESDEKAENSGSDDNQSTGDYSQTALVNEVNSCSKKSIDAYKCCNAPDQCGVTTNSSNLMAPPTHDPEGMKRYCEQMKYAGLQGRQTNSQAAEVCN